MIRIMYFLYQKRVLDDESYHISAGKIHIAHFNNGLTLCGIDTNKKNFDFCYADISLKEWLINRCTCQNCKIKARKLLNKN